MEKKLFGVYLDEDLVDYYTLLAVANGVTKSAILRELVITHYNQIKNEYQEKEMIKGIAFQYQIKNISEDKIIFELKKKGLNDNYINLILQNIKELNGKNKLSKPSKK